MQPCDSFKKKKKCEGTRAYIDSFRNNTFSSTMAMCAQHIVFVILYLLIHPSEVKVALELFCVLLKKYDMLGVQGDQYAIWLLKKD